MYFSPIATRTDSVRAPRPDASVNALIRRIGVIGNHLPRQCGIATFTHDMYASVAGHFTAAECFVVPVNDRLQGYDYPPEVRFEIDEQDRAASPRQFGGNIHGRRGLTAATIRVVQRQNHRDAGGSDQLGI